jgi:hypothetical protein
MRAKAFDNSVYAYFMRTLFTWALVREYDQNYIAWIEE